MKRHRYIDMDLLVNALIRSNQKKLKRSYKFEVNKDLSYTCPTCKTNFQSHFIRKQYKRTNSHSRRHYNLIVCHPKKLFIQSYLKNNMNFYIKGRRSFVRPLLTSALKWILAFDEYKIYPNHMIAASMLRNETKLYPSFKSFVFDPNKYKRVAISSLLSLPPRRDIKIPDIDVKIINKNEFEDDCINTQPNFKEISEVEPYIKKRIRYLLDNNFRTVNELLYVPSFRDSERRRKRNDEITNGMKKWIELVGGDPPAKKRRVGLLSN